MDPIEGSEGSGDYDNQYKQLVQMVSNWYVSNLNTLTLIEW